MIKKSSLFLSLALVLLSGCLMPSLAQRKLQRYAGGLDDEWINFGFSFHYVHADYKIVLKENWQTPFIDPQGSNLGSPIAISSPFTQGVGLGLLANLRIDDNMSVRFTPNIVFSNKSVVYEFNPDLSGFYIHDDVIDQTVRQSYVDLPLFYKYRSDRKNNYRGYVLAGGRYSINVVSSRRYDDTGAAAHQKYLKTKPTYVSYEVGAGFEFYFDFFKMTPEVRWSQSLGNLLDNREPNMFNHPIDRLRLRNFQVSLIFE